MRTKDDNLKIEYLSQYIKIKRSICRKQYEAEETRAKAEKMTTTFSDMPKGSPNPHSREGAMAALADMETDICADIAQLKLFKKMIEDCIASVENPKHKEVLECRYISGMTFEDILRHLDRESWSSLHRLHNKAIKYINIPKGV